MKINNNNERKEKDATLEGFEFYINPLTGVKVYRPIKGYSDKYINEDTFVPNNTTIKSLWEDEVEVSNSGKGNDNLKKAKTNKNDEFYTRLEDITEELKHYKPYFKDAVVYCPCDKLFNKGRSNFGRYFLGKFHSLGIKKLICTQYNPKGFGLVKEYSFDAHPINNGIKWEYTGEKMDEDVIDESEIDTYFLRGNGSFDSPECREIMKNCDIVVTNPPFSLFRPFLAQIMEFDKKFLIIGNMNAITYKEVFPLIKENKVWLGYTYPKVYETTLKSVEDERKQFEENGIIYQKFGNHCWFTNLEHSKRKEKIYLEKPYVSEEYLKYDNYDAIEVSKVRDIPRDYDGVMGVPITFLDKYNPEQFEILGMSSSAGYNESIVGIPLLVCGDARPIINEKNKYARIFIKRK